LLSEPAVSAQRALPSTQEIDMSKLKSPNPQPAAKLEDSGVVGIPTHPIATAAGALLLGAAAGAVAGTVVGPVGTVIGAAVGAVVGGLGGDALAASIDETPHTDYWRKNYEERPYVEKGASFDDFGPAYNYGYGARILFVDLSFDDAEPELSREWERSRGSSNLAWDKARDAARDAWDRQQRVASREPVPSE
jgi:hypothetical protein